MKKLIVMLLCAAMLLCLCACGQKPAEQPAAEEAPAAGEVIAAEEAAEEVTAAVEEAAADAAPILGGWTKADVVSLTVEQQELLQKATESLLGTKYIPVAFLGSQLVSGTNYALLCRIAPVTADPVETYAIVKLYQDLNGNVSLLDVTDSGVPTNINELPGGWAQCEAPIVTEELQAIFDKALEGYTGMGFRPIALIATQLVSGTNYCFFCESVPVDGGESGYAFVTVYKDLDGNAQISDVAPFSAE